MDFVHLQMQSVYSLLNSACSIEKVVSRAKELQYSALAITDENVTYGILPFYKECKKQGIKPIIGLTAFVLHEEESFPLVLLAKNDNGYKNILKIASTIGTKSKEGIPKKWLQQYAKDLIAITPGIKGEIEQFLIRGEEEKARESIVFYERTFEHFYFSVQQHSVQAESVFQLMESLSNEYDIPFVATNDVKYLDQEDSVVHECLLAIKNGTKLGDESTEEGATSNYYLRGKEEMATLFSHVSSALENTVLISNMCHVELELHQQILPKYPIDTGEDANTYLERLCLEGLVERYGHPTKEQHDRLTYELRVIQKMNFSDYFLIVADFMKYAHDNQILTGPGRGSAAGSLVAYVLKITNVDPLTYHLLFERFLNPERITMPDIDIDFPDYRRDEIIQYVVKKYGLLHVAQIVTFGTLAAKASIRDVARAMGLPPKEIDFFSKQIPTKVGISLKEAYEESARFKEHVHSSMIHESIYDIALKIEGFPRHTSTHAAGIIMSDKPLTNYVALQEGNAGVYNTQYTGEQLEEIGLLKMDFLGLRNLSLLEGICESIKKRTRETISLDKIPLDDEKTFQLVSNGDTTGVFQLESVGMRSVLRQLMPSQFEDIVAVNALYRPGPMEQIPMFIEHKHGKKKVEYLHPDLESILQNTYGIITYQEQIIQIAYRMAGFSLGEADLLRRAVSKKKKDVLDDERVHFVQGCVGKGYEEKLAHEVYDLIVRFANYGFNRSHAVAYSMIAYQLAYLKTHYPLDFMVCLLSSAMGNEEKLVSIISECKQRNLTILPPSINKSHYGFTIDKESIRYGLLPIKNIGVATLKEVMEERKRKPFTDLFDFCVRVNVNRRVLESLVYAGGVDDFGVNRGTLLTSLNMALEYADLVRPSDGGSFLDEDLIPKPSYVEGNELSSIELLSLEKDSLGTYISGHPTSMYSDIINKLHIPLLSKKEKVIKALVYISDMKEIKTKKGQQMVFLTVSDQSMEMKATIFPEQYSQVFAFIKKGNCVYVEGTMEERRGELQLIIKRVQPMGLIEEFTEYIGYSLYLKITPQHQKEMSKVKETLKEYPGYADVYVYYEGERKLVELEKGFRVHPTKKCIDKIAEFLGNKNVVLKKK